MTAQLTLLGNVGRKNDLRTGTSKAGKEYSVIDFTVASNSKRGGQDVTTWVKVTAWGRLAEVVDDYVEQGHKILVTGRLEPPESWTGNDGQPAATNKVTADNVELIGKVQRGGDRDDGGQQQQRSRGPKAQRQPKGGQQATGQTDPDDAPF